MNIKDDLCKAFCGLLAVNPVPAGYAVGTGQEGMGGDLIGFYVIGPDANSQYQIQDDGLSISAIEATGTDLSNKSRQAMFSELLEQYAVQFDKESGELKSLPVDADQVGASALRFLAFMLRVQDLVLTSTERTLNTFREDAALIIGQIAGDRAKIIPNYVVHPALADSPAELGIVVDGRPPVALFFGLNDMHVMEALLLQSYAENASVSCSVIALLENENSIKQTIRTRAANHLDAVPIFRGSELDACKRIVKEALGFDPTLH